MEYSIFSQPLANLDKNQYSQRSANTHETALTPPLSGRTSIDLEILGSGDNFTQPTLSPPIRSQNESTNISDNSFNHLTQNTGMISADRGVNSSSAKGSNCICSVKIEELKSQIESLTERLNEREESHESENKVRQSISF